jgi:hypothetical protein
MVTPHRVGDGDEKSSAAPRLRREDADDVVAVRDRRLTDFV